MLISRFFNIFLIVIYLARFYLWDVSVNNDQEAVLSEFAINITGIPVTVSEEAKQVGAKLPLQAN